MLQFIPVDFDPFEEAREIDKITLTNEPQREIWLSCIIGGNDASLSYNESVSLVINGDLNFAALKKAIDNLVLRHEALRATISPNGETLIIYKNAPAVFELQDISVFDEDDAHDTFHTFLHREMNTPLDLQAGPLFKVFLHKTGAREYYFTIIKHHIIGDGWSTGIILEDLSKMYNAYCKGAELTMEPAFQLSDYASAQATFKSSKAAATTENYWLNLYKDEIPVLDLPTDRQRTVPRTYKGHRADHLVSKKMADALKSAGAKQGASLVTTLLAAFEIFLYKITGEQSIVVGLPASGQAATGLTNVVGHCVNLLPLKTHIDAELSFAAYLKKRKTEVLDAYDHQRLTFGELLKKLYIARDPSRIPLVPVIFNIDMGMDNAVSFDGLDFTLISNPRDHENFEIYLNATGSKNGLLLEWSYNTHLFDRNSVDAFNTEYINILTNIINTPDILIADLTGAADSSNVALGAGVQIAPDRNILTMLAEAAAKYASKTALIFEHTTLSYLLLNEKADQLAAMLIQSGIGAGDIVAISLSRSVEMVVALLAVLKAGAGYTPLDPEYPLERTQFMLEDSCAKLLITSRTFKNRYPGTTRELLIDEVWHALPACKKTAPKSPVKWTDVAYLLYTSGSTGKPKGVRITHKNVVNFLASMQARPGITPDDRLLAITSISFDIACLELYLPLVSGACIILADNETTRDGRLILKKLEEQRISILQGTPSTWQMLLDSGWETRYPLKMFTGGEQLSKELAHKLLAHGSELWNMYAPTETTIYSTVKQVTPGDRQITIGKPVFNTRVYIMNEHGKPLPVGHAGEIYIGGDGVADGYLNRKELTEEKFVADPSANTPEARLYRTGDLGKLLPDGDILCMGRIDNQVKIRGHRIELGEIEHTIQQQKEIAQAVVMAREDTPGDKRLIAYVTLAEQTDSAGTTSWKDRWDTLYETGAKNKQGPANEHSGIDGTLLESLENSEELEQQRKEWLDTTVARIREIKPEKIYEIGSGAGQLLFALAGEAKAYMATDYAQAAITNINERIVREPEKWKHVQAKVAAANDLSAISASQPDLIIINSVAQYFPDTGYMIEVLRQAINAVQQNGAVFIGDMQGMATLEMYHAMDYRPRAAGGTTMRQFRDVVSNRLKIEDEFVADPAFFYQLPSIIPGITGVDVQLRKGNALNETTKYHFDVWLYTSPTVRTVQPEVSLEWGEAGNKSEIEALLEANNRQIIEIKNIPNLRTAADHRLMQSLQNAEPGTTITELEKEQPATAAFMHPDVFWTMASAHGYKAHVRWSTDGADGLFDVVFIPVSDSILLPAAPELLTTGNIYDQARTPAVNNEVFVGRELTDSWKEHVAAALPGYMVPDDFVVLKKMPLTPNAKVDRRALPKPQPKKETEKTERRTLTANEQIITDIWSEVLGLHDLRPTDNFFQLGGHSLLAVKVMVAIEKRTGKRLPIATLFNNNTIEKLAMQIADEKDAFDWDAVVPIKTTGSKTPVFLIHGAGMNILLFKSITEFFDAEQPVYGIQALGLNHKTDIPGTIEEIATRYVNEVVQVVPEGPLALAGYSMGGFIAYDMARQLMAMGRQIKFLGMMDTYAGNNQEIDNKATHILNKIGRQFKKVPFFAKSFINDPAEALKYQVIVTKKRLKKLKSPGIIIPENIFSEYDEHIIKTYDQALDNYVLAPLDVKVFLFRVKKRLYYLDDLVHLGWGKFAQKGVQVLEVPGDHKTFLYPPNSIEFAKVMQRALDSAQ